MCACIDINVSGNNSLDACSESAVINAGIGIADFRDRIPKQTAASRPDSVLDVVLTFASAVTQSDRDRIASYNGTHVQTAGTAASLKAEFTAQDVFNYVTDDTGRLSDVVIYIPACTIG